MVTGSNDVVVVSAGPTGEQIAGRLAGGGLGVAMVEKEKVGAEGRGHVADDGLPGLDELRAGDERAYEELVTVHSPWMQRVARKYVQSAGLAEDIVQETWLAVLRELDTFQGRSSLRTWIFKMLVNQAKSAGRRERRVIAVDPLDQRAEEPGASAGWLCTGLAASAPQPEDLIVADETVRNILAAVAMLPPRDAQIIALRDIEGLSASEVAERLGISNGNQRVLLHRARVRLRALLCPGSKDRSGRKTSGPVQPAGNSATFRPGKTTPQSRSGPIRPRQTGTADSYASRRTSRPASDILRQPSPQAAVGGLCLDLG
jgi:RNA polymerase sigma-70 factor (ECF subfamily)